MLKSGQEPSIIRYPLEPEAVILTSEGIHFPGIQRALAIVGFQVREVSAESYQTLPLERPRLLIVPEREAQRLDSQLVQVICRDVEAGTPLLLDGPTPLADALGVQAIGARNEITQYRWDRYARDPVRLPGRLTYSRLKPNPALYPLAFDTQHQSPLLVAGSLGRGRFIYSAVPLEPPDGIVFQYLPFLAQSIVDELHVSPCWPRTISAFTSTPAANRRSIPPRWWHK